jgi:hypothetical protein
MYPFAGIRCGKDQKPRRIAPLFWTCHPDTALTGALQRGNLGRLVRMTENSSCRQAREAA